MSLKTGKQMLYILFDGAYILLAVMVEGDESSRRFWSATGPYLNMRSMSLKTGKQMLYILFDGAYILLAVMVEGDESSWQFWSATGPYLQPW